MYKRNIKYPVYLKVIFSRFLSWRLSPKNDMKCTVNQSWETSYTIPRVCYFNNFYIKFKWNLFFSKTFKIHIVLCKYSSYNICFTMCSYRTKSISAHSHKIIYWIICISDSHQEFLVCFMCFYCDLYKLYLFTTRMNWCAKKLHTN